MGRFELNLILPKTYDFIGSFDLSWKVPNVPGCVKSGNGSRWSTPSKRYGAKETGLKRTTPYDVRRVWSKEICFNNMLEISKNRAVLLYESYARTDMVMYRKEWVNISHVHSLSKKEWANIAHFLLLTKYLLKY